jgi:pimeloyl-ACP methyl ester carboxylesterase
MPSSNITRRSALGSVAAGAGLAAAAASGDLAGPARAQTQQKTFVLVHGAWHGGWCWRRVSDLLEKKGHKAFSPTLTGVGERSHLLSKDVNLDTHITDIVNVFKWEDLKDVCLVVHSYGGWPGSGALEQIGDRVSSIVWVDAFKPEDGQRGTDYANDFSRKALAEAVAKGEPGRPSPKAEFFKIVNEKDRAWVDSKTTQQPNGVALQPIKLTGAREKVAKKTYIRAAAYPQPAFDKAYADCKADKSWQTYEAACGHDVMVDEPQWLVDILVKAS